MWPCVDFKQQFKLVPPLYRNLPMCVCVEFVCVCMRACVCVEFISLFLSLSLCVCVCVEFISLSLCGC